ncbi:DUF1289 domain-containing protein [Aliivibrio kagoshimensis]|uniref:DUF1289 domain-containing protein n=1 Tax=Aliivibrio kagoshimensis TaxID=2910230 RepID=UPI003D0BB109
MTDEIDSPCIRNCCLNEVDVCLGCFRTLEEITHWKESDDAMKRKILDNAKTRQELRRRGSLNFLNE